MTIDPNTAPTAMQPVEGQPLHPLPMPPYDYQGNPPATAMQPEDGLQVVLWLCNGSGQDWEERDKATFDAGTARYRAKHPQWTVEPLVRHSEAAAIITSLRAENAALRHDVESAGALRLRMEGHKTLRLEAEARAATLQARLDAAVEALKPFVNVRDQYPESIKLITKALDGFTVISVNVTKDQFLAARQITQEGEE